MGEGHAYGYSLGCVSRRLYVQTVSWAMTILCCVSIFRWFLSLHVWESFTSSEPVPVRHPRDCTGMQCFEVLTCFGLKDATHHVREPLTTVAGAALLPFGILGAHHCSRHHLRVAGVFLSASAALHVALLFADLAYVQRCGAYPTNIVMHTLVNWLPPSPVTNAAQDALRNRSVFSIEEVAGVTGNFHVLLWYVGVAGCLALFLAYSASEALLLADLAERGPLGLGMHYGIQWDQVYDYDAIRRQKCKELRSKFLDDASLPRIDEEAAAHFGHPAPASGYGSTGGRDRTDAAFAAAALAAATSAVLPGFWEEDEEDEEGRGQDQALQAAAAAAEAREEEEQQEVEEARWASQEAAAEAAALAAAAAAAEAEAEAAAAAEAANTPASEEDAVGAALAAAADWQEADLEALRLSGSARTTLNLSLSGL